MAYIRKDIKNLISLMDRKFIVDTPLRKWIKLNIYPKHNLIIKTKKEYRCTNCNEIFYDNTPIGDKTTCPKCKMKLLVRLNTLKYYKFCEWFRVLEYVDGYFVLRGFEVLSEYHDKKFSRYVSEHQRLVIGKDNIYLLFSNKFKIFLGNVWIDHSIKHTTWRLCNSYFSPWYWSAGIIYTGNIDVDINNTPYQYCDIKPVVSETKDFIYILQRILRYPLSYELLIKMGLTNLAVECDKFFIKGSFEKRFGVSKDYLPFIQKYNLTYKELKILGVIKRKNIRIIRKLSSLNYFDELNSKLDILKALNNGLNKDNESIYRDYLDFAERLKFNMKDKKILYPDNLKQAHDQLLKQIKDNEDKKMVEDIEKRYIELKGNTYKDKKYIIYPVPSYADLLLESSMQHNCVRTYNFRYANHEIDLYFMRLISNQEKSLVTIEVKDNMVVQSKIKNNQTPTKEQLKFIESWENNILKHS